MFARLSTCMAFAFGLLLFEPGPVRCDEPATTAPSGADPAPQQVQQAIERGLAFLVSDAVAWREKKTCATCHHGTMTVWALSEARSRGYPVAPETLAEMVKWTSERLNNLDKPRDTRPGWRMLSTPALYLAVMARSVPDQDAVPAGDLKRIADHLLRHQESDGSWAWSSAPPGNRYPPVFESDEVATLLAGMAMTPHIPADPAEKSAARESVEKAAAWLGQTRPADATQRTDTTQAAAFRLLARVHAGESTEKFQKELELLLVRQRTDGSWSQLDDLPGDAYATGQALYVLNLAGVRNDRVEIQRGVAFLTASQKEDGSWPMTPRGHPGSKPAVNTIPITYFGSAWGTLGLLRSAPKQTTGSPGE